jgi:DtxR family Mn-dependent transcriptional regulator
MVYWILLAAGLTALLALGLRHWSGRGERRRALVEDALKHLLACEQRGQPGSADSLAGVLGLSPSRAARLVESMEERGVLRSEPPGLRLTAEGERWALQVVRAHRLWESYLADEAGRPLSKIHHEAEEAEHYLRGPALEALDAHLGHPQRDPHGDPIPAADGSVARLEAVPLTNWPPGAPAQIVHLEDEPEVLLQQITAAGLRPGAIIRVLETRRDALVIHDGMRERRLPPLAAGNIHVAAPPEHALAPAGAIRLSELRQGASGEVVMIDPQFRGFARRRLLDLGLTPHTLVKADLRNPFGDPRAFRVRGATIALRSDQAAQIWVKPV